MTIVFPMMFPNCGEVRKHQGMTAAVVIVSAGFIVVFVGHSFMRGQPIVWTFPRLKFTSIEKSRTSSLTSEITNVLLFTYMRGGSSLFGEMFNQDDEASYWFEPLNGLYSALYGHHPGWRPLDILLRTSGRERDLPEFEQDAIIDHLGHIFQCNLSPLHQHVKAAYSTTRLVQRRNQQYADCLQKASVDFAERHPTEIALYNETYKCLDHVAAICPIFFRDSSSRNEACHDDIALADTNSTIVPSGFKNYSSCMKRMILNTAHCVPELTKVCSSSSLVAIKVIRLKASLVNTLLARNPTLKVVHLLRDPRGIIVSRRKAHLISDVADDEEIVETKYLCDRMASDLRVFTKLQDQYPGRILSVKYEDLAQHPLEVVKLVYQFLGRTPPPRVLQWFQYSMSGFNDTGKYGTMRMSSEQTAFKWQQDLVEPSRSTIDQLCNTVISHLDNILDG